VATLQSTPMSLQQHSIAIEQFGFGIIVCVNDRSILLPEETLCCCYPNCNVQVVVWKTFYQ